MSRLLLSSLGEFFKDPISISFILAIYLGSAFGLYEAFFSKKYEANKRNFESGAISKEEYKREKLKLTALFVMLMIFVPPLLAAISLYLLAFVLALGIIVKMLFK